MTAGQFRAVGGHPQIVEPMNSASAPNFEKDAQRSAVMLRLVAAVAQSEGAVDDLFDALVAPLSRLMVFDVASFCLPASIEGFLQLRVWEHGNVTVDMQEIAMADSTAGWVWENQQPLLISNVGSDARFRTCLDLLAQRGIASFCEVPLSTAGTKVGTLGLGSSRSGTYGLDQLELLQWVGGVAALAMENALSRSALGVERKRLAALREIQGALASQPDLTGALPEISRSLQDLLAHDLAGVCVLQPDHDYLRMNVFDPKVGTVVPGPLVSVNESLSGSAVEQRQVKVYNHQDLISVARYPSVKLALEMGARSACLVPLVAASGQIGVVWLASRTDHAYRLSEIGFLQQVSGPLAVALESSLLNEALRLQGERLETLADISTVLVSTQYPGDSFPQVSGLLRKIFGHDYATVALYDKQNDVLVRQVIDYPGGTGPIMDSTVAMSRTPGRKVMKLGRAMIFNEADLAEFDPAILSQYQAEGFRSLCFAPLHGQAGVIGVLGLCSKNPNSFQGMDLPFLEKVALRIAFAAEHSQVTQELQQLKDRLKGEQLDREGETRATPVFGQIVGHSKHLIDVLHQVSIVAPSDATVLVLGETGTGKDSIAKAIHEASPRREKNFVNLNCTTIPAGLLESELFGHEKGAYTGATSQKIGRVESAHLGTLFLDEIGEIPIELQPKLLRVLQDREFERVGGTRTIKVDIRLIAATNRDLEKSVTSGEFRKDLYYRLHVFPIRMPALRDRRSDIPDLVRHFVNKYEARFGRHILSIPSETMKVLMDWHWPGNIRELENIIERSVILTEGTELRVPVAELHRSADNISQATGSLDQTDRDHIIRVLRETGGLLSGPDGAAGRLGVKRTTLQSKMQRLGITRSHYSDPN